ncbi:MAG: hypothetical protein LUQ38_01915 [Methanotrichaceae archaeon]|nr:hypothetical protein [Methanotrichaceae archaeon]
MAKDEASEDFGGVGIFSTFAGFITNSFLAPRKKKKEVISEPSYPKSKVAEIKNARRTGKDQC